MYRIPSLVLLSLALSSPVPHASAAPIVFDLNDGGFVTLAQVGDQPNDYTGIYQSPLFDVQDVTIAGGQTANFDFVFHSGTVAQFIRLIDVGGALPNEGVIFDVFGSGDSTVNPIINLTGATGSYRQDLSTNVDVTNAILLAYAGASEAFAGGIRIGEFSSSFPNDPSRFAGVALDVTQSSLLFRDLHLEIFNQGPNEITISSLSFQAIGSDVQVGGVPEPGSLALLALGLSAVGYIRRNRPKGRR